MLPLSYHSIGVVRPEFNCQVVQLGHMVAIACHLCNIDTAEDPNSKNTQFF